VNGDNATIVAGRVMPQRMVVMAGGELKLAEELYKGQFTENELTILYGANVTIDEGATKAYLMGWLVLDERAATESWPVRYF
jgi:hypothetical protein